MTTWTTIYTSPIGPLTLYANERGLSGLHFEGSKVPAESARGEENPEPFEAAIEQLDEYFAGAREIFDLPLALSGTPFQLSVWKALCTIPFGETWSYGELAKAIGNPKGMRAVGLANGRNPVAVIVPCHRVIGADGSLTGFGGGLPRKRFLLELENREFRLVAPPGRGSAAGAHP
jgi:methylated-DNA-[protein]-cysteine S-methyltransferase